MRKCLMKFRRILECGAVQKCVSSGGRLPAALFMVFQLDSRGAVLFSERRISVNLVDFAKSFQTSIYFQNLAWIQPRTGLSKFAKIYYLI